MDQLVLAWANRYWVWNTHTHIRVYIHNILYIIILLDIITYLDNLDTYNLYNKTCLAKTLLGCFCGHSDVAIRRVPAESEFTIGRNVLPQLGILRISQRRTSWHGYHMLSSNFEENYGMLQGDQNCSLMLRTSCICFECLTNSRFLLEPALKYGECVTQQEVRLNLGQPKIMNGSAIHLRHICRSLATQRLLISWRYVDER